MSEQLGLLFLGLFMLAAATCIDSFSDMASIERAVPWRF
jgi:hypothetical protein